MIPIRRLITAAALAAAVSIPLAGHQAPSASTRVEQTAQGTRPAAALVESFEGLGASFTGPQGTATVRSPSDNSLAVGPDHVVQTVNSRLAVFTKKGKRFDTSGKPLYGPVPSNTIFAGFGGVCEARNNGDVVVRYDQLANRWLVVMPIFGRIKPGEFPVSRPAVAGETAPPGQIAVDGQYASPGPAVAPPANPPAPPPPPERPQNRPAQAPGTRPAAPPPPSVDPTPKPPTLRGPMPPAAPEGTYAICYAVSTTNDPLGPYYRYAFERTLFPDYPRPAIWPDGYYVPTSTGDHVIQKHACVAERDKMLKGLPAREHCLVIDDANFLNNADVDGQATPPRGAPNIMMATGGAQLRKVFDDDGVYAWAFHVDWADLSKTTLAGPVKIAVAPYHYLCEGQLTNCVPQPGIERRLDAQGDKLMQRLVYRRLQGRESIVAVHSVSTAAGGGGVRWYEFRLGKDRQPALHQQGTFAPDGFYRWMASPAMDRFGNIGIGFSFGGAPNFAGQRFAARLAADPPGVLSLAETILVEGGASQSSTLRWEDYATTAIDPADDCTFWYAGDYLRAGAASYSSRIGAFRLPGCGGAPSGRR
jgi:hypothetical protein